MAALAAAVAAASTALTSLHLSRPLKRTTHLPFRTLITSSLPPSPKPDSNPHSVPRPKSDPVTEDDGQLYIPWIVNGNSTFAHRPPPASLLLESTAKKSTKKMKMKEKEKARADVEVARGEVKSKMKLSKAARRYYNENYRDQPQRLAKVLAAAGGNIIIFYANFVPKRLSSLFLSMLKIDKLVHNFDLEYNYYSLGFFNCGQYLSY